MNTVKVKSYAKVNLTLDVVGTAGGYHLIDSLVASINLYDLVCVKKRKDNLISVSMHGMDSEGIPPEQNNAFRAGETFVRRFSTKGADITVYKNIPIGAGLGGSSAEPRACFRDLRGFTARTTKERFAKLRIPSAAIPDIC